MNNINKIIDLANQRLDNYNLELISLLKLEKEMNKNSFSKYELLEAKRRLNALAESIDNLIDEED